MFVVAPSVSGVASSRSSGEQEALEDERRHRNARAGNPRQHVDVGGGEPHASHLAVAGPSAQLVGPDANRVVDGSLVSANRRPPISSRTKTGAPPSTEIFSCRPSPQGAACSTTPSAVTRPARRESLRHELMQLAAIGPDQPQSCLPGARHDEHDPVAAGGPHRDADRHTRIAFERDLAHARRVGAGDPQIAVAPVVREIDDFRPLGTDRRRLNVAGLSRDPNRAGCVLRRRAGCRDSPDVRPAPEPRRDQPGR